MKKPEIARMVARGSQMSGGEAADTVDQVVCRILSRLRQGKEASLPGLGSFTTGPDGRIAFTPEGDRRNG